MKTAYCILGMSSCGFIKFSDELLARVEELKKVVGESALKLKGDTPWVEHLSATIVYGGMKWVEGADNVSRMIISSDGPVVAYSPPNYRDLRCVDDYVSILIGSDDAVVGSDHEEGSENPLGYSPRSPDEYAKEYTLGTMPDVLFSEDFLRAWCEHLGKHHLGFHQEVIHVVEDMPAEHRVLLDKAVLLFIEDHKSSLKDSKDIEQKVLREFCEKFVLDTRLKVQTGTPFRLGLDFHGVIDDDPEYFSLLSKSVVGNGGEVHILTGSQDTPALHEKLDALHVKYTHLFSICSHHTAAGTKMWEDDRGQWMDAEVWDKSKAEYCREHGIHLHFDDSTVYGKHFDASTVYVKYPEMTKQKSTGISDDCK